MPQTLHSYAGARAALKGILTDEQLTKLDALVKSATREMVVNHGILRELTRWKNDGVVLAADQGGRIEGILAAAITLADGLAPGDEVGARHILNDISRDLNNVLTPQQRIQVMHPTP
jgi:hypothetical protein